MKKDLEIVEAEDKQTKAGKTYSRIKTNEGWMSCFDKKTADDIKENIGKWASLTIKASGDFQNIEGFNGLAEGKLDVPVETMVSNKPKEDNTSAMTRAVALKCAVQVTDDPEKALSIANEFIKWLKQ